MFSFLSKKSNKQTNKNRNKSKNNRNTKSKNKRNNKSKNKRNNKLKNNRNKSKKNIKQDLEKMCLKSCEKSKKISGGYCMFKDPDNKKYRCVIDLENGSYPKVDSFYKYLEKTYGRKSFNKDGEINFSYINNSQ